MLRNWILGGLGVALFTLSITGLARADDNAPDVVLLKNGGRVRGLVVEESPTKGVRIKLLDGVIKTVPPGEVDKVQYGAASKAEAPPPAAPPSATALPPAAPPAAPAEEKEPTGSIHVEAAAPGVVSIDGGQVGPAPADVKDLPVGVHRVRVDFDGGGRQSGAVFVREGEVSTVKLGLPAARSAAKAREGIRPAFGAEPFFMDFGGVPAGGVRLLGGINYGIIPAIDIRAMGFLGFAGAQVTFGNGSASGFLLPIGARASARFNLGSIYTIEVGAHAGGLITPQGASKGVGGGGPDVSVLSFRLGPKREFEITALNSLDIYRVSYRQFASNLLAFEQSIGMSYVLPN